ncbi:HAD family hydrolase [Parabacteroides acidifaciens]|uniref:phosphoserine phosphatase n=1 Tax=Parabacteroides acidifaciens TaxID=2290935 RepID=A0A3D8HIM2_9BACT|nr:HAD-IB family phosphatase [Parabacteroides acidifaciens]RDU50562.1 HAD family hydrolase [Parabacteroides acidifaciens]
MIKFIFDLDGTITKQETLPLIAENFGVQHEISQLTQETVQGNIPFIESFIRRVHLLGELSVSSISNLLIKVPLYDRVLEFIRMHLDDCVIATGNLDCWSEQLTRIVGCTSYFSHARVEMDKVVKLETILRKEQIVRMYKEQGYKVVFIGDGNNDLEAMRLADVAIATGLTHFPSKSILPVSDYLIFNEITLCRLLNQLY